MGGGSEGHLLEAGEQAQGMAGAAHPTSNLSTTVQSNSGCPGRAWGEGSTRRAKSRALAHKHKDGSTSLQISPGSAVS